MELDEERICADFDRQVEQGIVIFNKDYQSFVNSDNGFQFEFRLLSGLDRKPKAGSVEQPATSLPGRQRSSGPRPGSDIDVSGYEMAEIGPTHLLALNKFSAARPHLLLLTQDGFRRQHEALDIQDFTALWQVLSSLGGGRKRYLAIFNCGIDGGCSRLHKHMQLFPAPDADKFALWPDSSDGPSVQQQVAAGLPFKCFIHRFENGLPLADALLGIYQTLLAQAEDVLDRIHEKKSEETGADEAIPHNVVLDRNWILVVPRRAAGVNGADANAAAMLGMVWVANDQKLRPWMEHGPANVLARVGVPADIN